MKQSWRLLGEFRPPVEPRNVQEAVRWVHDTLPELGLANLVAERLVRELAETVLYAKHPGQVPPPVSCRVFVPAGQNARLGAIQDWTFFLVTGPACTPGPDKDDGRQVIQVFLYPAA